MNSLIIGTPLNNRPSTSAATRDDMSVQRFASSAIAYSLPMPTPSPGRQAGDRKDFHKQIKKLGKRYLAELKKHTFRR
jgi:hypothetical protein